MAIYSIREEAAKVARHFLIAAIWADCEEGTNPRPSAQAKRAAFNICHTFMCQNPALSARALDCAAQGYGSHPDCGDDGAAGAFGHDLWLTMRGHGAGFWDRSELPEGLRESLTNACRASERLIGGYWQANGWFYISEGRLP